MKNNFKTITQEGGATLSYTSVPILEVDGFKFKDLNRDGILNPYEDWRLSTEERVQDLVKRMNIQEIAGLMLYSRHITVSTGDDMFSQQFAGTYGGKKFADSDAQITDLTDEQKQFLSEDLRHVLLTTVDSAEVAAVWSNNVQAFVEGIGLGIPANNSTDPRHGPSANSEFDAAAGGDISKWPEPLGLAATFSEEKVRNFGHIAAKEYRALGIATALSPQIDLATDPRWMRFNGTFGEDVKLSTDLARAYIDGFQTSEGGGWGSQSVNAMVKHWPGGGSGEAGRDAHYGYGKYAVYPGDNYEEHKRPFTEGAFKLEGGTSYASAVMPYYTISYDQDLMYHENVGNSYSKFIIQDELREGANYDGVVCTDWMITGDAPVIDSFLVGKSWGVEDLSVAERHYKILMAGVDQFGGNNDIGPVLEAYEMGVKEHGEAFMRNRFELSGKRLLRNIFNTGLFENPYVDVEHTKAEVGKAEYMEAGYKMQMDSIVLLKNKNQVLPMPAQSKVYIPNRRVGETVDWFGNTIPATSFSPVEKSIVERNFIYTDNPDEADFAMVFIESPKNFGYEADKGYLPISLQYRPYTATHARPNSIAGYRSYLGKSNTTSNEMDLDVILETRQVMGSKPIIVSLNAVNPTIVAEFEAEIDGLLINFNTQTQAVLDLVVGKVEPSALLPFQMPASMQVVEEQFEDRAHDMQVHIDTEGHAYDFAYGLNFKGIINDERTKKYRK